MTNFLNSENSQDGRKTASPSRSVSIAPDKWQSVTRQASSASGFVSRMSSRKYAGGAAAACMTPAERISQAAESIPKQSPDLLNTTVLRLDLSPLVEAWLKEKTTQDYVPWYASPDKKTEDVSDLLHNKQKPLSAKYSFLSPRPLHSRPMRQDSMVGLGSARSAMHGVDGHAQISGRPSTVPADTTRLCGG